MKTKVLLNKEVFYIFDYLKNIFKKQNCSICNIPCSINAMEIKENKYICYHCKNKFNKLNDVSTYYNQNLFEKSSFEDIYNSILKNNSISFLTYTKEYQKNALNKKIIIENRTKYYNTSYSSLTYKEIELSTTPVCKQALKDIINFKTTSITSKTSDLKLDNFVVIDTETTGLNAVKDELLEIAAIKFIEGKPVECLTTLLKPKKEISNEITNINHITNEMVSNSPNISFVIKSFYNFLDNYNIVAYNTEFDIKFLYKNGLDLFSQKRQFFDALQVCKKYYKNSYLPNYKLDTICNEYGIHRTQAHRAVEDALATGIIFNDLGHKLKNI